MRCFILAFAIAFTQYSCACRALDVIEKAETGTPPIRSINVIDFAPGGVLLVGDGAGSQVIAIETGDTTVTKPNAEPIEDFRAQVAGHLGTKSKGIEIIDLAVNPASHKIYVAVRRQADRQYVIVTVSSDGKIRELSLEKVKFACIGLAAENAKISLVTDVAWADDRLVAAGRSNETFASKIFSVYAPLKHNSTTETFSAETFHVSHRRWETKAPMSVLLPFKENGKTFVIGAFSCTPVVKYPLESLKPGAKIKGTSVMELGSGNRPIDMFTYKKGNKNYVLSNTFRFHHARRPFGPSPYWTVKFEQGILSENEAVNEKALQRLKGGKPGTDRVEMVEAFHGVTQMAKLGDSHAAVLRETKQGVNLEVVALP
jgi:hypothetical protein